MRRIIVRLFSVFLAIMLLQASYYSAHQTLTTCTAQSRTLIVQKGRPIKIPGTVAGRTKIEYRTKPKAEMDVNVKLINTPAKLDVYSLSPSTLIRKSVDNWSGHFSAGKEYLLVINNCSGKAATKFQIEITSN